MAAPLPPHLAEFLAEPNPAVMGTLGKDGRPVTVATWYLLEPSGQVLLNLDGERVRLGHIRRDPRIGLTAIDLADWGNHVSLQLVAVSITDDEDLRDIDAIATHYTGSAYPVRDRPRVSVRAEVRSWHGWGEYRDD
jgi:PPOX class probable F420-dependent enzyme